MNNLTLIQKNLKKYKDLNKLEIYKQCIKERLSQSLENYNEELNINYLKMDNNIDEYWKRREKKCLTLKN